MPDLCLPDQGFGVARTNEMLACAINALWPSFVTLYVLASSCKSGRALALERRGELVSLTFLLHVKQPPRYRQLLFYTIWPHQMIGSSPRLRVRVIVAELIGCGLLRIKSVNVCGS